MWGEVQPVAIKRHIMEKIMLWKCINQGLVIIYEKYIFWTYHGAPLNLLLNKGKNVLQAQYYLKETIH